MMPPFFSFWQKFRKHVEQAISPHRSGVYLVYVDVQTVGNQNHPFQNQLKNERIEQTQPIINRKRRKEKTQYFILFFAVGDYRLSFPKEGLFGKVTSLAYYETVVS